MRWATKLYALGIEAIFIFLLVFLFNVFDYVTDYVRYMNVEVKPSRLLDDCFSLPWAMPMVTYIGKPTCIALQARIYRTRSTPKAEDCFIRTLIIRICTNETEVSVAGVFNVECVMLGV